MGGYQEGLAMRWEYDCDFEHFWRQSWFFFKPFHLAKDMKTKWEVKPVETPAAPAKIQEVKDKTSEGTTTEKNEENIVNNRKRTSFKTTEKMSTFLVAWVIVPSDYGYIEGETNNGVPVINF